MKGRGFSLVEILFVVGIVAFVAWLTVPALNRYLQRSRVHAAVQDVKLMAEDIKKYERTRGALPATLADVGYSGKTDPWGNDYRYVNLLTSTGNGEARKDKKLAPLNSDFDLYSVGADGATHAQLGNSASRDDIVRARDGRFIGLAAEFDP